MNATDFVEWYVSDDEIIGMTIPCKYRSGILSMEKMMMDLDRETQFDG
jgi:hypothetical protein